MEGRLSSSLTGSAIGDEHLDTFGTALSSALKFYDRNTRDNTILGEVSYPYTLPLTDIHLQGLFTVVEDKTRHYYTQALFHSGGTAAWHMLSQAWPRISPQ